MSTTIPGYGQSGPAPQATPNYGRIDQAPAYGQIPPDSVAYSPQSVGITEPANFVGAMSGPRLVLASWPRRVLGALVDWLPMIVLGVAGSMMTGWVGAVLGIVGFLYGLVNIGYMGGSTGVSLGRKLAGTKLVREETLQPIGGGQGIGRYIVHIIDEAIFCVGFLFPLWTKKKQTIADMIMNTIVIDDSTSRY